MILSSVLHSFMSSLFEGDIRSVCRCGKIEVPKSCAKEREGEDRNYGEGGRRFLGGGEAGKREKRQMG